MTATFPAEGGLTFAQDAPAGAVPVADGLGGVQWGSMPQAALEALLPLLEGYLFRPGDLKPTASGQQQEGFLLCDAASYLRAEFPRLFAALGGEASPYGLPDADHFNVPDLRGRAPIGPGTGTGGGASGSGAPSGGAALTARKRGDWLGEESHVLSAGEIPAHTHPSANGIGFPEPVDASTYGWALGAGTYRVPQYLSANTGSNAGGGGAHNTIPPSLVCNWLIKT